MNRYIFLTPKQAEMLADRLSLPDCISDALEGWELSSGRILTGEEGFDARCRTLERLTLSGRIETSKLDELDRLILADAHDGSTWFAMQEAEVDPRDGLALSRIKATVCAVQRKLAAAGIKVSEPVLW
jgi:hypothetical protein